MRHSRNSSHYLQLRNWLIKNRENADLSIRALAARLGVHHSIIGKIEDGTRKLELFEFIEYCQALDIDPKDGLAIATQSLNNQANDLLYAKR